MRHLSQLWCVGCLLLATGCLHRELTIRSEPPGASILLNDADAGTTPRSFDFMWYGTYRVILTKDGYETLYDHPTLNAPWYVWIPFDLVMEVWPWPVRDIRELSYQLVPKPEIPGPSAPTYEDQPSDTASPAEATTEGR